MSAMLSCPARQLSGQKIGKPTFKVPPPAKALPANEAAATAPDERTSANLDCAHKGRLSGLSNLADVRPAPKIRLERQSARAGHQSLCGPAIMFGIALEHPDGL